MILELQHHSWKHAKSCFKFSAAHKKETCRYDFPREVVCKTSSKTIEDTPVIFLKCQVGNEYVNNFNRTMLHLFKCNHDVRLLMGSAGITFYALKYSVKPPNDHERSLEAGLAALKRREERYLKNAELDESN